MPAWCHVCVVSCVLTTLLAWTYCKRHTLRYALSVLRYRVARKWREGWRCDARRDVARDGVKQSTPGTLTRRRRGQQTNHVAQAGSAGEDESGDEALPP